MVNGPSLRNRTTRCPVIVSMTMTYNAITGQTISIVNSRSTFAVI